MEEISLALPEEIALWWRTLARESGLSLEEWISQSCVFVSVLGIPIADAVLRQPPAERELQGVAWELGRSHDLRSRHGREVSSATVPVVDIRTERRRNPWSTK